MGSLPGIKPPRVIKRAEAMGCIIAIEGMIHRLVNDCHVSGMTCAANLLDSLTEGFDSVYEAIATKD